MKCFFFFPPHTTELQGWKTTSFFNRINHHMQFSFLNILLKNCTNIRTVQIIFNFKSYNGLSSYLEGTLSRSWYFARSPLLAFDWKHFPVNSAVFAIVPHVFIRAEIEDNILNFNTHSALITTFLFISINSYNSINILPPPQHSSKLRTVATTCDPTSVVEFSSNGEILTLRNLRMSPHLQPPVFPFNSKFRIAFHTLTVFLIKPYDSKSASRHGNLFEGSI